MSHIIYLVIISALCFVIIRLAARNVAFQKDIVKIEQGKDEIADSYYSDSLQYDETIEKLKTALDQAHNSIFSLECDLERSTTREAMLEDLVADLRERRTEDREIIIDHQEKCLPHLSL